MGYLNIYIFVIIYFSLLISALLLAYRRRKISFIPAVVATVYIRLIQNVTPALQALHDSHRYMLSTMALFESKHLVAPQEFIAVYPSTQSYVQQFNYPINTTALSYTTGINLDTLRIILPAIIGALVFFAAYWMFYQLFEWNIAIIASIIYVNTDALLPQQLIYHQQALATLFTLLLLGYIIKRGHERKMTIILVLFTIGLVSSHNFTPVFFLLVIMTYYILSNIRTLFKAKTSKAGIIVKKMDLLIISTIILLGSLLILTNFWVFALGKAARLEFTLGSFLPQSVLASGPTGVVPGPYRNTGGESFIDSFPIIIKAVFATLSLICLIIFRDDNQVRDLGLFSGIIFIALLIGGSAGPGSIARIYKFGFIPATFLTVRIAFEGIKSIRVQQLAIFFIAIFLVLGGLSVITPSYIDPASDIRADEYHNVKPVGSQGIQTGLWVRNYHPNDTTVHTHFLQGNIAFYYGRAHEYDYQHLSKYRTGTAIFDTERKGSPPLYSNTIYSTGRLYIVNS